MSPKQDDLYARAWEYEYEQTVFDAENNNAMPPNSPKIPVQSDLSTEKVWNTLRPAHECSPEIFPQTEELCEVTDTYPNMKPDVETSSEQPKNGRYNPRSSKYILRRNPEPDCNDDYTCYSVR